MKLSALAPILLSLALSPACRHTEPAESPAGTEAVAQPTPEPTPQPEPEPPPPPPDPEPEWNKSFDEAARILAGLPLDEGSASYALTQSAGYKAYAAEMEEAWNRYAEQDHKPLKAWAEQELADIPAGPVFYPFSGPDILNAVTLYPRGKTYILFGLEPIGGVPDPARDGEAALMRGLGLLKSSLSVLLGRNYFITQYMAQELSTGNYNGVTAVMMFFLARTDHEVLDARKVELSPEGAVIGSGESDPAWGKATQGVEIRFRDRGTKGMKSVQTVWYFPGDASDGAFSKRVGLSQLMLNQGEASSLLKAASFLMYNPEFDDVRSMLLARSGVILSEDSGIPFHYLDTPLWDLSLYGNYDKPIKDFSYRCQPDLKKALEERGKGPLEFNFGYQFRTANHIIVSRRAEGIEITEPRFDASNTLGEGTTCSNTTISVKISRSY